MNRRKGTPCACECDPCKGKNSIRAINNVSADPNGDFTIEAGNGIGITTGENKITIINQSTASSFIAGDNIEINPSGDDLEIRLKDNVVIGGDLTVNGTYYTVHAEHVYTEDDYIIMRDGASTGLGAGDFSGFQVKLYDGVNDGRLVIDSSGTARVGDVGDEEPLLTRDESADLTDGAVLKWDAANFKAVNEGTVGDDTHPIKSVDGVLTPVTNEVALANWTDVTNDLSKIQTAHEILFQAVENNTFVHSTLIAGSRTSVYVGVSAGGNYLNVLIQPSGITTISSAGTWTLLKVFVR